MHISSQISKFSNFEIRRGERRALKVRLNLLTLQVCPLLATLAPPVNVGCWYHVILESTIIVQWMLNGRMNYKLPPIGGGGPLLPQVTIPTISGEKKENRGQLERPLQCQVSLVLCSQLILRPLHGYTNCIESAWIRAIALSACLEEPNKTTKILIYYNRLLDWVLNTGPPYQKCHKVYFTWRR